MAPYWPDGWKLDPPKIDLGAMWVDPIFSATKFFCGHCQRWEIVTGVKYLKMRAGMAEIRCLVCGRLLAGGIE